MIQGPQVGVILEVEPRTQPKQATVREDSPFRILVLADLGGETGARPSRPVRIDRDDYDEVLDRVSPRAVLSLSDGGRPVTVRFGDIDHFHPDYIRGTLPLFQRLRSLRDRLDDPKTFESAARELLADTGAEGDDAAADTAAEPSIDPAQAPPSGHNGLRASTGGLLDRMLDEAAGPAPASSAGGSTRPPPDDLQSFIREAVGPHLVPGQDPRRGALVAKVDAAAGDVMRRVLHDPAFRAVESAWRSLFRMVREIETGPKLTIDVVDMPREALAADLELDRPLEQSLLHRLLVDEPAEPWSVVIGDYTFGPDAADVAMLARIAEIARAAGTPFIAAGHASLSGCPRFQGLPEPADWRAVDAPEWAAFRRGETARFVGLAQPRVLLRLPYGRDAEPAETFEFDELADPPDHEEYLWGNPAYLCAILLAHSFRYDGAAMQPGRHLEVGGLPLHLVRRDGTTEALPCAESLMSERAAARILDCGLMPVASLKGSDAVRLVRFQSVSDPASPLAGRWSR